MTHSNTTHAARQTAMQTAQKLQTLIRVAQEGTVLYQTLRSALDVVNHAGLLAPSISQTSTDRTFKQSHLH